MLPFLTHMIFGLWFGYLFRRAHSHPIKNTHSVVFIAAVTGIALIGFTALEIRPAMAGVLAISVGAGAHCSTTFKDHTFEKLKRTRAGIWLPVLYLLGEFMRFLLASSLAPEFKP